MIAKNVLSQVDRSGFHTQVLESIVIHKRLGNAVSHKEAYKYNASKKGVRMLCRTAIGWCFLYE